MDANVTIPIWFIIAVSSVFLPWLLYLTHKMNANAQAIALEQADSRQVKDELAKIYQSIEKMEQKVDTGFSKTDEKFDRLSEKIDRLFVPNPEFRKRQAK